MESPDWSHGSAAVMSDLLLGAGIITPIAIGASQTVGPFPVSAIGCKFRVEAQNVDFANTKADVEVTFEWSDAGTGKRLGNEAFDMVTGDPGQPHVVVGAAKAAANQCVVRFETNPGSNDATNVAYWLWQSSGHFPRLDARTLDAFGSGYTLGSPGVTNDILLNSSPAALASGASWTRLLPLYTGRCRIAAFTTSNLGDATFAVKAIGSWSFANWQTIYQGVTNGAGVLLDEFQLPRVQCMLVATNANALAQTLSVAGVMSEMDSK